MFGHCWVILMVNLRKQYVQKLCMFYFYPVWSYILSIRLWENTKTIVSVCGIFGRVPEPPNQVFLFLETPGYLKIIPEKQIIKTYYVCLQMSHFPKSKVLRNLEKTGADKCHKRCHGNLPTDPRAPWPDPRTGSHAQRSGSFGADGSQGPRDPRKFRASLSTCVFFWL